ncbi:MAG: hypothetical protein H6582_13285 [Crocinitomicaceae bacterium]|nr:hypothetical protein [Crocinitomicaceae bacterium]
MKAILSLLCLLVCIQVNAQQIDQEFSYVHPPIIEKQENCDDEFKVFELNFDWMLDTQTEVINGIWYSPTLEFNLNRPNGICFQLQTGALPTLSGYMINKTQPSAGISLSYRF